MTTKLVELTEWYGEPIQELVAMDGINEICVNKFDKIWYELEGQWVLHDKKWDSENQLVKFIELIGKALNQPINQNYPVLDARLADGSRVNAVLPPVGVNGANMTLRPFPKVVPDEEKLLHWGAFNVELVEYFKAAVAAKKNIVVAGGTGSGKTTLLRLFASWIPADDRVVVVEDTAEFILIDHPNFVSLEAAARKESKEAETIDMSRLIKNALRMRPDRLIIGEVRDAAAAIAFLTAINTGHDGIIASLHSSTPEEAISRISELTEYSSARVMRDIDLIVWVGRELEGKAKRKRVRHVLQVGTAEDPTKFVPVFRFDLNTGDWKRDLAERSEHE